MPRPAKSTWPTFLLSRKSNEIRVVYLNAFTFVYSIITSKLSLIFYNIFLWLYKAGISVAALFNNKAKKWVSGRKNWYTQLQKNIPHREKVIWMHCASLGEFEQGRPVLERIKIAYPGYKILLTFFSPSGYEAQKSYPGADWVMYLPMDSPANARKFIETVNPSLVLFVKYEFWYYFLKKIKYSHIPLLLISGIFWEKMVFFRWYGGWLRKMLHRFDHLFVQNAASKTLLDEYGLADKTTVSGDTRFDRVVEIASRFEPIPFIEQFTGNNKVIVAGSTWPEDEVVLQKLMQQPAMKNHKLIIAPHEINTKHIESVQKLFPNAILYSALKNSTAFTGEPSCLIIDNIGMLSRLYHYAYITYVGGGLFSKGVHNVLEAAVHVKPVLYGPYHQQYAEATGLVKAGGGISFTDEKGDGLALIQAVETLMENEEEYKRRCLAAGDFVQQNKGATAKIISYIQENLLLTN